MMTIKEVKKIVDNYYNIDISKKTRKRELVYARFIFYKLCKEFCKVRTLSRIGKAVKRDHSSVLYGVREFKNILFQDDEFEKDYLFLKKLCEQKVYDLQQIIDNSKKIYGTIRIMHPMRIYGKEPIRKIFKQRR
jgi:hypothetical protein